MGPWYRSVVCSCGGGGDDGGNGGSGGGFSVLTVKET